jgi:hypothetical protein
VSLAPVDGVDAVLHVGREEHGDELRGGSQFIEGFVQP